MQRAGILIVIPLAHRLVLLRSTRTSCRRNAPTLSIIVGVAAIHLVPVVKMLERAEREPRALDNLDSLRCPPSLFKMIRREDVFSCRGSVIDRAEKVNQSWLVKSKNRKQLIGDDRILCRIPDRFAIQRQPNPDRPTKNQEIEWSTH